MFSHIFAKAAFTLAAGALMIAPLTARAQQQGTGEVTLGFDGLPDLSANVGDFGVSFTGASVLQCGSSLNCSAYPPFSGRNIIYDTPGFGGVIAAVFDPAVAGNVRKVSARITGNRSITMTAFDVNKKMLGTISTGGSNYVGSGTGLPANMLLTITVPSGQLPVTSVTFHDSGNTFTIDDFTFTKGKTVMLDAGHGQIKVGNVFKYQRPATATYQLYEDNLTLDMAESAKTELDKNYGVILTRSGATAPFAPANCGVPCNIDLDKRKELAEKYEVDVFVSLHTNASADKKANGAEAFYRGAGNQSSDLASRLVAAVSGAGVANRGSKAFSYRVLSTTMSNSLVEIAFHTNSQLAAGQSVTDEFRLSTANFKGSVGSAIAKAVDEFIKANP